MYIVTSVHRLEELTHSVFIPIPGLSTPVEMKLKLIPILQQMYHDIGMASQVLCGGGAVREVLWGRCCGGGAMEGAVGEVCVCGCAMGGMN